MRGQKKKSQNNITVQEHNCDIIQEEIFDLMDWVGSTEQLSEDTIPLLSKLLDLPINFTWENFRVSQNLSEYISFSEKNVSSFAIQTVREMSTFDTSLYTAVKNHYKYNDIRA
mmetsp:Transcript_48627/g.54365  ORF Transcript_48627/g.54365 Transcript_48627/m.54365 type:complete len:113 (-) Transcript_48627:36-374(-)